jgi:co-chaperonin GroES (HSP10)
LSKKYVFEPAGNYIAASLVEEKEKVSPGGIVLAGGPAERPCFATVISVGPGMRDMTTGEMIPVPYKAGDLLAINSSGYRLIPMKSGTKIAIFGWGDVFGKISEIEVEDTDVAV